MSFQSGAGFARPEPVQGALHIRQAAQGVAQCAEVPRCCAVRGGAIDEALDVAHTVERLPHPLPSGLVLDKEADSIEPLPNSVHGTEGRQQPLAEQARAHRRDRAVDDLEERDPPVSGSERLDELQVAPGHFVQRHGVADPAHRGVRERRQSHRLQLAGITEEGAGRAERWVVGLGDAESLEAAHTVVSSEVLGRVRGIEVPRLACGHHDIRDGRRKGAVVRHDDLTRIVPRDGGCELIGVHSLDDELARREVDRGDPRPLARIQGDQEVVAGTVQPIMGEDRARADDFDHLPTHQTFSMLRVFDLFTDCHTVARLDQAAQVLAGSFDGNTGEGDVGRGAIVPHGERETKLPCGELGVLKEHLVEVPHAEKQHRIAVTCFDGPILLHQRRVGGRASRRLPRHCSSTTNGLPPRRRLRSFAMRCASSRIGNRPTRTRKSPSSARTTCGS